MGRPSLIDAPTGERDDGTLISVADRIVNAMRAGSYFEPACAANGIPSQSAYRWLHIAGRLRLRARGGPVVELDPAPTEHELRCLAFCEAVEAATGTWEIGALAVLEQLARGGIPQVRTVVKTDAEGNVTERTETTEHTLPDKYVLTWRLERRFPDRYGRRIEVTGADGGPVELSVAERANALADSLLEHQAASKANAQNSRPRAPRKSRAKHSEKTP